MLPHSKLRALATFAQNVNVKWEVLIVHQLIQIPQKDFSSPMAITYLTHSGHEYAISGNANGGAPIKKPLISTKFSRLMYNSLSVWNETFSMFHHKRLFTRVGFLTLFSKIAVKIGSKIHKSGLVLPFLFSKTVKNICDIQITKIFKIVSRFFLVQIVFHKSISELQYLAFCQIRKQNIHLLSSSYVFKMINYSKTFSL